MLKMNANDPSVVLTLAPDCKHLRGRLKQAWRRLIKQIKDTAQFGLKADAILGFVQKSKKHGKIVRSQNGKRT